MKKILLINLLFVSTLLTVRTYGQTTVCQGGTGACNLIPQDVRITVLSQDCDSIPGKTVVTFDINFKLLANNGNKQIYFHTWLEGQAPASLCNTIFPNGGSNEGNPYTAAVLGDRSKYGATGY